MVTEFAVKNEMSTSGQRAAVAWLKARGWEVVDVSGDTDYQKRDIDLVASKNGAAWDIEVKNDARIAETGNVVYELLSCAERATQGWAYYIGATHLFYVDDAAQRMHIIVTEKLRELVKRGGNGRRVSTAQTRVGTSNYTTVFLLLPLREVKSLAAVGGYKEVDLKAVAL